MYWRFPLKLNGNTLVELAVRPDILLAMISRCWINSHGIPEILVTKSRRLRLEGQMPGGFMTYLAWFGSGVATGILKTFLAEWIQKAHPKALIGCIAEVVVTLLLTTVGSLIGTELTLRYVLLRLVSA